MPQKPLKAAGKVIDKKKKEAANRHGKAAVTRKGKFDKPPKKVKALEQFLEEKDVTKAINKRNEGNVAAAAENSGGKLKVIKAPPPVLAPKDKLKKGAKAAAAAKEAMEE